MEEGSTDESLLPVILDGTFFKIETISKEGKVLAKCVLIERLLVVLQTPVERLFSYGGMIFSPKRKNLSDSMFESLILMKANKL